mgnify:FL=1
MILYTGFYENIKNILYNYSTDKMDQATETILKGTLLFLLLLDDKLLTVLTFWLKCFIDWRRVLSCHGYSSNVKKLLSLCV